jgi:UDP-N-acetylglucosamine diphosphorylase/glucosamine-1-phosphate N-acetyltransferase
MLLHDDAIARRFEPLASTRPLGEVRAGALLVRERWQHVLGVAALGFSSAPHLHGFAEFDAPAAFHAGVLPAGSWLVNTRALPFLTALPAGATSLRVAGRVAAVRVAGPLPLPLAGEVASGDPAWPAAWPGAEASVAGVWLDGVWDLVGTLAELLLQDIPALAARLGVAPWRPAAAEGAVVLGDHPVFLAPGAVVEPYTVLDTRTGPILVERDARIHAFTRIAGPCAIGPESQVTADRVGGCAIGPQCRVHGELSASILLGHANKAHDGFVGHSVLGRWVNLGAGTTTSNLRLSYGATSLWTPRGRQRTPLQFLGTFFGDHVKTGIGMGLQTGTVIGAGSSLFGAMPPTVVPPFRWGGGAPYAVHATDAFLSTATRAMARRQVAWTPAAHDWWRALAEEWGAAGPGGWAGGG